VRQRRPAGQACHHHQYGHGQEPAAPPLERRRHARDGSRDQDRDSQGESQEPVSRYLDPEVQEEHSGRGGHPPHEHEEGAAQAERIPANQK
jgi:hypothetical protein